MIDNLLLLAGEVDPRCCVSCNAGHGHLLEHSALPSWSYVTPNKNSCRSIICVYMGIPDVSATHSSSSFQLKGEGAGPLPPVLQQYALFKEDFPEYLLLSQTGGFTRRSGKTPRRSRG